MGYNACRLNKLHSWFGPIPCNCPFNLSHRCQSLSIKNIVNWQIESVASFLKAPSLLAIPVWIVMATGFTVFVVCLLAELELRPFDIPEAETEIVGGWQVEFSGKKLCLLVLGRDIRMVLASALLASLFLGGAAGPLPIPPIGWFIIKTVICLFILSNLSTLLARYRIDQLLLGSWKYLIPLSALQVMAIIALTGVV
ncbi:MAG: NADH-quinone oxidoreductase subunit H [Candidatus Bathyarchaeia archaeon]